VESSPLLPLPAAAMNPEKLAKMAAQVRTGGKGSVRRKKKAIHKTTTTDDKRLQNTLKRLGVNNIPAIEEVNLFKDNGTVIHFNNPKGEQPISLSSASSSPRSVCPRWLCGFLRRCAELRCCFASRVCAVQASIAANTYVVSGHAETKKLQDLLPGIINQLGPDNLANLKKLAETYQGGGAPPPVRTAPLARPTPPHAPRGLASFAPHRSVLSKLL